MNLKILFYRKYIIIFTFLSFISIAYGNKNFPVWKNNQNIKPLPQELSNSEIVGISYSNITDKTLYLTNENNVSYLYFNEKKYENKFPEELVYLDSPLIEYNDEYYFCSSSKNILKFNQKGELTKIENPSVISGFNDDYKLKCFYLNSEKKVIIVTFINTPYICSYDLTENNWMVNNNQEYQLKLGSKIYDSNLYNILDIFNLRFGVLYEEESKFKLKLFQYINYQFGDIFLTEFEGHFYSKTKFSYGFQYQQIFIFTYEPNSNNFNFYQLDLGRSICMNSEGNLYLRIFKDSEIFNAEFIENSPVLYYVIRKKESTGKLNFYLGAVDIESLTVLYNIKLDKYKNIFYNDGNLYKNKGYLSYFEGGNQVDLCPFIYDSKNGNCQYILNEDQLFDFETSSDFIENKIADTCSNKDKLLKYCLEKCPIGYQLHDDKCIKCMDNEYYNYGTQKCIFEDNIKDKDKYKMQSRIIYNCEEAQLKYYDYECYKDCSEIYGIDSTDTENECISCKEKNQIYYSSQCYDNCSVLYGIINPDNDNECIKCETQNKIYYNLNCYDNCSEIYGIINPKDKNECISCQSQNKIYYDFNCYNSCSDLYGIVRQDNENECEICKNKNKYYLNQECIDKCSEGYETVNTEVYNYSVSYCQNCFEINKYYYKEKCYEKCPYERQLLDPNNICYFCHEKYEDKKYYQDGNCVSECEKGYESIIKDGEYYCIFCKNESKYFAHNSKCEEKCEKDALADDKNICYFCSETELKYRQDDKCIDICDEGYEINVTDKTCKNCKKNNLFFQDGKCVKNCSDNFAWDDNDLICINCQRKGMALQQNLHKCVENCHNSMRINDVCKSCGENAPYYFNYHCYEICPKYTIEGYDSDYNEHFCRKCDNVYLDGRCSEGCPSGYSLETKNTGINNGTEVNVCIKCGEDNLSWYNGEICVKECKPNSLYGANDHFCRPCFCGFSNSKICEKRSDKCQCSNLKNEGEIFGDNCELFSQKERSKKLLEIIPPDSTISSQKNIFTFKKNIFDKYRNIEYISSLKWRVYLDKDNEVADMKYFTAGVNEEKFIINSGLLKANKDCKDHKDKCNKISLELIIKDKNTNKIIDKYEDELIIDIQELDKKKYISFNNDGSEVANHVMSNTFTIDTSQIYNIDSNELFYKILIEDEHFEKIPLKQTSHLQPLLKNQIGSISLKLILPIYQSFIFEISNARNEKIYISTEYSETYNTDNNFTLEDIIKKDLNNTETGFSDVEKIFLIMKYFINEDVNLEENEFELLIKFIKEKLSDAVNEGFYEDKKKYTDKRYYINYYEPKTIFSLMNKILLNQKQKMPDKYFNQLINIFLEFINPLTENKNPYKNIDKLPNSDILSLFRTFDHLLDIYIEKENEKNCSLIIDRKSIFNILEKLSEYLIRGTYSGETIRLVGKRVLLILTHFGKYQNNLGFSSVNDISQQINYKNYNTFSFDDYYLNKENCDDGNSLLCIRNKEYREFIETMLDKINVDIFSLALLGINNTKENLTNENEGKAFKLKIMNTDDIRTNKNKGIFYDIEFSIDFNNYNNEKNYSNITCVPKNYINNKEIYCMTYFNYNKNNIKCICNIFDEITYISNFTLSNFYKDIQYEIKRKRYGFINKASIIIIFVILIILLLPNCIYLLYEIRQDEKNIDSIIGLTFAERIKKKYLRIKKLGNSSIFSFAFYLFLFKFPFLSPLRQCESKNPKYIKHFIITLGIFYGFLFPLIPFSFGPSIKEREQIIDRRDVNNPNFIIYDLNFRKYFSFCTFCAIIGVILTHIFIYIFGIILSYNKDELNNWRELKTMFSNYISSEIKRNVLLGNIWNRIKLRMISYINICGDYILKKKNNKTIFDNYLSEVKNNNKLNNNVTNQILPTFNLEDDETIKIDTDLNDSKNMGSYRAPSIDSINLNLRNDKKVAPKTKKDKSENYWKLNVATTDNFQLYSKKIKINKKLEKYKKFERIKNKYICVRKSKNIIETEIDSVSENRSYLNESHEEFHIEYEYNFSYFPLEQYMLKESLNSSGEKWNISHSNSKNRPEGYSSLINANIILFLLLLPLVIIILFLDKLILNYFGFYFIRVWMPATVFVYFIVYPLFYFVISLIASLLLFKRYHLRNKTYYYKILFSIFIDKSMIYIFKVRNYITKYKKELEYE